MKAAVLKTEHGKSFSYSKKFDLSQHIRDSQVPPEYVKGLHREYCKKTLPPGLVIKRSNIPGAGLGVFATVDFPFGTIFGPFGGKIRESKAKGRTSNYSWQIIKNKKHSHFVDASDPSDSNWLRFINCSRSKNDQCLTAFQFKWNIYFIAHQYIHAGTEILVYYGSGFAKHLGIKTQNVGSIRSKRRDIRRTLITFCVTCKGACTCGHDNSSASEQPEACKEYMEQCTHDAEEKNVKMRIARLAKFNASSTSNTYDSTITYSSSIYGDDTCSSIISVGDGENRCGSSISNTDSGCGSHNNDSRCGSSNSDSGCGSSISDSKYVNSDISSSGFGNDTSFIKIECHEDSNISLDSCRSSNNGNKSDKHISRKFSFDLTSNTCKKKPKTVYSGIGRGVQFSITNLLKLGENTTFDTNLSTTAAESIVIPEVRAVEGDHELQDISKLEEREKDTQIDDSDSGSKISNCRGIPQHNGHGRWSYHCSDCGMKFSRKWNIERHLRIHSGKREEFMCGICDVKLSNLFCLRRHEAVHLKHKPKFINCTKQMSSSQAQSKHQEDNEKNKAHKCIKCGITFSYKCDLTTHDRVHTGTRPFGCDICTKRFSHKTSLKTHMRIHTGERPYLCSICEKRFTQLAHLQQHKRRHHAGTMGRN